MYLAYLERYNCKQGRQYAEEIVGRKSADPMRRVLSERMHRVVDDMAREMDPSALEEVLAIADPLSGMSVALERVATKRGADHDPLAASRARAAEYRQQLIKEAGGIFRLSEASEALGVTPQAVTGRRQRGTILAVTLPNGEWVYPRCQFTPDGLVEGLDAFLAEFADVSPWTQLAVLLGPSERYGGRNALELLRTGLTDEARSISATYGRQG